MEMDRQVPELLAASEINKPSKVVALSLCVLALSSHIDCSS